MTGERELLERALPLLRRLGDFIGNGPIDPERAGSLGERCDLIGDINQVLEVKNLSTDRSLYVGDGNRYVVMLAVGYAGDEEGDTVESPTEAAFAALDLTQDEGWTGTHWLVLDRETGNVETFEQDQFAQVGDDGRFALKEES